MFQNMYTYIYVGAGVCVCVYIHICMYACVYINSCAQRRKNGARCPMFISNPAAQRPRLTSEEPKAESAEEADDDKARALAKRTRDSSGDSHLRAFAEVLEIA